jgi:hypothetical protein
MRCLFGIWLLTGPRSFHDPRICREDRRGALIQTPFQRAVGVRYRGRSGPPAADALLGFGSFAAGGRPRSVLQVFKGHFDPPLRAQHLALKASHRASLRHATGYAIVSTRRLRRISLPGATFIGTLRGA